MSMIDDADDNTKNAIKRARERQQQGDTSHEKDVDDGSATNSERNAGDDRETSGDVPVDNLE